MIYSTYKIILICFFSVYFSIPLLGQNYGKASLIPSESDSLQFELSEVLFEGNNSFSSSELIELLSSRPNSKSFSHYILRRFRKEFSKIKATPQLALIALDSGLKARQDEIKFIEETKIEQDMISLKEFYNINGFHDAFISYFFKSDPLKRLNFLIVKIKEGKRFQLKPIKYIGLDSIPNELSIEIARIIDNDKFEFLNENSILSQISSILDVLKDNGFYYARLYSTPSVSKDTVNYQDSLTIRFVTGKRQKIAAINLIDSTRGQNPISYNTHFDQLFFKKGDWYSRRNVKLSEENLRLFGVFDVVQIDTSSIFNKITDSTLSMIVFCQYRKLQSWNLGFFANTTKIDKQDHYGIELEYMHKNLGGKVQMINPFIRADVEKPLEIGKGLDAAGFTGQAGFKFGQPLIKNLNGMRIGGYANPLISYKPFDNYLRVWGLYLPLQLTASFQPFNFINNVNLDLSLSREEPEHFYQSQDSALSKVTSLDDKAKVKQNYEIYRVLNTFVNSKKSPFITSAIMGLTLISDHRDNLNSPKKGYYFSLNLEVTPFHSLFPSLYMVNSRISGISKYFRTIFTFSDNQNIFENSVLAFKFKIGYLTKSDSTYIPQERQLFAGGSNSVRAWGPRELRYTKLPINDGFSYQFARDFVGSSKLIETSVELRQKFNRPDYLNGAYADLVSMAGFEEFIDIGNTFGWYADKETQVKSLDYITKLAIAGGVGLRLDLGFLTVRFDFAWPIYDPVSKPQFLWQRENEFKTIHFQLGIGNAF
ncbi:MAG: BamA/TamA family outer membrane protein [Candidatus Kapabacteria bacterium]|nr:BamA/TamA family outer membrane protein [Candidatus Kapabacteria bacterium]